MSLHDQVTAAGRLRQALMTFEQAQDLLLSVQRQLRARPQANAEAMWNRQVRRIGATVQACAKEVTVAFKLFSKSGLVANTASRQLVAAAEHCLAESAA